MLARLVLALALALACAGTESIRKYAAAVEDPGSNVPAIFDISGTLPPHWTGSTLIGIEANNSGGPLIYLIRRDGSRDQFSLAIPGTSVINVHGMDVSSDGAVAITAGGDSLGKTFLVLIPPDHTQQRIIRTWPYVAWEVVFVPDGSLWTVGYTFHETQDRVVQANVMAHFDRDGSLLTSGPIVAKARFGPGKEAAMQHSFLRISEDRVGWLTNGLEYIEFSFDGRELARYGGPAVSDVVAVSRWGSFALSTAGDAVFSSIVDDKAETWQLDRDRRQWSHVDVQDQNLSGPATVLGFDGTTLVTTGKFHEMRRYVASITSREP